MTVTDKVSIYPCFYVLILFYVFILDLQKLGNSTSSCGFKTSCGLCGNQLELPGDRQWKGKANYFNDSKCCSILSFSNVFIVCGNLIFKSDTEGLRR